MAVAVFRRRGGTFVGAVAAAILLVAGTSALAGSGEIAGGLVVTVTAESQVEGNTVVGQYQYQIPITQNRTFDDAFNWDSGATEQNPIAIVDPANPGVDLGAIERLDVALLADPLVDLNFNVRAGAYGSNFTITSAIVMFDPRYDPWAYATTGVTVTDRNFNGATLTGLFDGGAAYHAMYNSPAVIWAGLLTSPIVVAPGQGTNVGNDRRPAVDTEQILGTIDQISSQFKFSLSASDAASGTSTFEVGAIPEPATLSLLVLGGAVTGLVRRRR